MKKKNTLKRTAVLIILDGFGHREEKDFNAIAQTEMPNWESFWSNEKHRSLLGCSGKAVGLPEGQMGNSEVGHMHIGSGRLLEQDLTRINDSAVSNFQDNLTLEKTFTYLQDSQKTLHLMGLLSSGGVHSHVDHLIALLKRAYEKGISQVCVHAFLDGRDTPPKSAMEDLIKVNEVMKASNMLGIVTLSGRFYAMDRDNRWDRVQKTYDLLTDQDLATGNFSSPMEALEFAYSKGQTDEFIEPISVSNPKGKSVLQEGDAVLFFNFRSDRAKQLTEALNAQDFSGFERRYFPQLKQFLTMTKYNRSSDIPALFEPINVSNTLGEYLSLSSKTQLRIAETEKYAHVTYFMNCGIEQPFDQEDRKLIPSPKVTTYDLQPEMSAVEVTDELVASIGNYDAIICNYANGDMVGHTGNFEATCQALSCLDQCLGRIKVALDSVEGQCLITADHGNVEYMFNAQTGQAHTAHTIGDVPLVYIGSNESVELESKGSLIDIAPTFLSMMNLPIPTEMSGKSLLKISE